MAAKLGSACRRARTDAGLRQIDVATEAGVQHTTISHFEAGRWWARDTDRIVEAYAKLCNTTARALWLKALESDS